MIYEVIVLTLWSKAVSRCQTPYSLVSVLWDTVRRRLRVSFVGSLIASEADSRQEVLPRMATSSPLRAAPSYDPLWAIIAELRGQEYVRTRPTDRLISRMLSERDTRGVEGHDSQTSKNKNGKPSPAERLRDIVQ